VIKLDVATKSITLSIGESEMIQLTVKPVDTTLKFTSKNTSIATVSSSGAVTAISAGETEIEIEASKDKYKTVTKTVSVTVLAPPTYTVTFNVSDDQGAVQGANVAFNGENKSTDAQGKAVFTGVLAGSKAYTVSKEGYNNSSGNVNVDGDETVNVTLTKKTYTIAATAGAGGSINPSGNVNVEHGANQTFTITPNANYNIEDVLVDGESVGPRATYTFNNVTTNHTIHAIFSLLPPPTYTVTFNVNDDQGAVQGANVAFNGENKSTDAQGKAVFTGVLAGSKAYTVSKEGYNNASGNVNVDGDETVNVTLTKKSYTIAATAGAGGSINPSGNVNVEHGANQTFTITPNENYNIEDVLVDGESVGPRATYTFNNVTTNHTIHAAFSLLPPPTYTVTFNVSDDQGVVQGANVTFNGENKSTDAQGKAVFTGVLAGSKAYTVSKEGYNNASGNVNVDSDETVDVTLTKKTYTLTVNTVGQGTVTRNPDKATYNHGEVVQLTANPAENWIFTGWSGDLTGSTNPANITMNANKTVTANFTRIYTVTFNVSDDQGVVQGANVAFNGENKSTDAQGKAVFTGVLAGSKAYTVSKEGYNNASGNVNVDGDEAVDVTLTKKTYTLTVNTVGQGTVNKNPDKATYNHGEVVQLTANPAENWIFTGWSGDLTGSTNPANITMNANKTVTANFTIKQYTITATAGAGGSINPSGDVKVNHGANQSFTIAPNAGYDIEDVKVDGSSIGAVTNHTFTNVTGNHTIAATFKIKTYTISVSANPPEGGTASGGGTFNHNQQVNLSATPNAGYQFLNWTEGGSVVSTKANYSFPATGNRTLVANFNMIKGTIEISDTTIDGFGQIEVYAENFGFNVGAIEYVLSYDPAKLSILAMANNPELNWTLQNLFKSTDGIIHFVGGGQPVDLSTRKKIATITVSEVSSGSTAIGFTKYIYNDVEVETAVTNDSQPPEEIRSPDITLVPGTITIN
jgi:uncharacterized repeat protein (TIGR02543 family)